MCHDLLTCRDVIYFTRLMYPCGIASMHGSCMVCYVCQVLLEISVGKDAAQFEAIATHYRQSGLLGTLSVQDDITILSVASNQRADVGFRSDSIASAGMCCSLLLFQSSRCRVCCFNSLQE